MVDVVYYAGNIIMNIAADNYTGYQNLVTLITGFISGSSTKHTMMSTPALSPYT